MADNIIGNMFGVDPDQLRMQRFQQIQQQNAQMAQLDPFQRASAAMANVGAGAAMLGAQALGLKTPEEQRAEVRRSAMTGVDASKPESLYAAAQKLQQVDPAGSAELVRAARQLEVEKSAIGLQAAQTEKALREPTQTIETGVEGKPEYRQKMQQQPDGTWKPVGQSYRVGGASGEGGMKPGDELRFMNQHSKDFERASTVIDTSADANTTVRSIKTNPKFGYLFGGYTEKTLSKLAPGEIAGMQSELSSLKSNLMSTGLNLVKSSSQAGIGSITEKEWPIFENMITNLDQKMDEKTAKAKLDKIEQFFERTQKRAVESYEKKWKSKPAFYDPSIKERLTQTQQEAQPKPSVPTQGAVRKYNPATGRIE